MSVADQIGSLAGREVMVTGASSGIGREIAIALALLKANLTLVGRNTGRLEETLELMEGTQHKLLRVDLSNPEEITRISSEKKYDGVVFNAGIVEYVPVKFISNDKIRNMFSINFDGTVLLCQHLLKNKLINKGGSFVFISSASAFLGVTGTALYAASKAAVNAFSKVVAMEVAGQKIRSNTVCPGIIITPLTEHAKAAASTAKLDEGAKTYPLGYGTPEDVSGVVSFLLSDASRWMTGNNIMLDGGLTLQ
jgi:NAD(P)-dependent dehydrogenase (short-subunit alcohol dehydrogenase family)